MIRLFYNIFIYLYSFAIHLASPFNKKAKLFINGRKQLFEHLKTALKDKKDVIWIHCASVGEFEQARPLIDKIKEEQPSRFILLTFFSSSGYEAKKNFKGVDYISYLPMDFNSKVKKFIKIVNPKIAIFVKYEFWFNFLRELRKQKIKTYLISGIFRRFQHFFTFYGQWSAGQLSAFTHFFVQNKLSSDLLYAISYQNTTISGDSRFDRVMELAETNFSSKRMDSFCEKKSAIIFGSSWAKEHQFALAAAKKFPQQKLIIAPHEININQILKLKQGFSNVMLWSETDENTNLSTTQTLIIDQIGMLSKIYRYGKIAVIGGGFGAGIHNTLEAAVYGCPIIFGPNFDKFQEASDLIEAEAAFVVENETAFLKAVKTLLTREKIYQQSAQKAKNYVKKNVGATETIYRGIFKS